MFLGINNTFGNFNSQTLTAVYYSQMYEFLLANFKKMLSVNVCLVKIDQLMDSKND